MTGRSGRPWRLLLAAAGAVAARVGLAALPAGPASAGSADGPGPAGLGPAGWAWLRTNFRGRTVSLAGGPALAGAASLAGACGAGGPAAAAAVLTAGLGSGAVGLYDDLVGARPGQRAKGFHGHLAALRRGQLTSGVAKIAGIGVSGLVAAALVTPASPARAGAAGAPARASRQAGEASRAAGWLTSVALGAGVVAGAANLLNLLDLRPGRALKVGLLAGVPLACRPAGGLAAGPVGAAAAVLPEDLAERTMLGDCGANALGAVLGTVLVARTGPAGRAVALAVIAGLTAASERVSFTQVIARTPVLRQLDELGRRTGPARPAGAGSGAGR